MSTWYAILDQAANAVRCELSAVEPTGLAPGQSWVRLPGPPQGPPPFAGARRRVVNGALVWIESRTLGPAKQAKAGEIKAAAAAELLDYLDEIGELLAALANGQPPPAQHRVKVSAYRDRVQAKRLAIQAATTLAEVDAIIWGPP